MLRHSSDPGLLPPPPSEGKACLPEFFPSQWEVIQEVKGSTTCQSAEQTETAPKWKEETINKWPFCFQQVKLQKEGISSSPIEKKSNI